MTTGVKEITEAALNWTTQCRCGDALVTVNPEMVQEPYAVHHTIKNGRAVGPGYTITHRPSGLAVWHVREFAAALAVVKWLNANLVLPDTEKTVVDWKDKLAPTAKTRLVAELSAIAPREYVAIA